MNENQLYKAIRISYADLPAINGQPSTQEECIFVLKKGIIDNCLSILGNYFEDNFESIAVDISARYIIEAWALIKVFQNIKFNESDFKDLKCKSNYEIYRSLNISQKEKLKYDPNAKVQFFDEQITNVLSSFSNGNVHSGEILDKYGAKRYVRKFLGEEFETIRAFFSYECHFHCPQPKYYATELQYRLKYIKKIYEITEEVLNSYDLNIDIKKAKSYSSEKLLDGNYTRVCAEYAWFRQFHSRKISVLNLDKYYQKRLVSMTLSNTINTYLGIPQCNLIQAKTINEILNFAELFISKTEDNSQFIDDALLLASSLCLLKCIKKEKELDTDFELFYAKYQDNFKGLDKETVYDRLSFSSFSILDINIKHVGIRSVLRQKYISLNESFDKYMLRNTFEIGVVLDHPTGFAIPNDVNQLLLNLSDEFNLVPLLYFVSFYSMYDPARGVSLETVKRVITFLDSELHKHGVEKYMKTINSFKE